MQADDLMLRNAQVISMNPNQPSAEAVAIRAGRITAVGTWDQVRAHQAGLPVMDLGGKTVVPGMIDTHVHFLWTAMSTASIDVSPAQDHESLTAILSAEAGRRRPSEPLVGMGYSEYALDSGLHAPIIQALDAIARDRPIYLIGISGHSSAVNSFALKILGFSRNMPGVLQDAGGQPSGMLTHAAHGKASAFLGDQLGLYD